MAWRHQGITEQAKAAFHRKRDARALLNDGDAHARGAMYLGGYAIECKIKAKAMERLNCLTLAELRERLDLSEDRVYSHGLESLLTGLLPKGTKVRLLQGRAGVAFASQVNRWTPQWRYSPRKPPPDEARQFLDAVDEVWNWLENNV